MNARLQAAARRRAGFSLIELVIASLLFGTFAGSLVLVLSTGTRSAGTSLATERLEGTALHALERVVDELTSAGASALVPDPTAPFGSADLIYQRSAGIDGEAGLVWSTPRRLALQLEDGEEDDGLDNDGDGLVDESKLVWTADPGGAGERSSVWAHGVREHLEGEEANGRDDNDNGLVDERGLSFVRQGRRLTIRLSVEERDGAGSHLVRTLQTSVRMRN